MSVHVVAPVRCPHCRSRLMSRTRWRSYFDAEVRWCKRCQCTVSYAERADAWHRIGALREGDA